MRHYPAGLPPDLTNRIARSYAGRASGHASRSVGLRAMRGTPSFPHYGRVQNVDGFFSSFKAIASRAFNILAAPIKLGITAPVKLLTGAAREIGLPVKRVDSWLNKEVKSEIRDVKTGAPIAAGVAASIFTGGAALPVLIPTIMGAASQLYNASKPPKPAVPMAAAAGPNPVLTPSGGLIIPGLDVNAITGQPMGPDGKPLTQQQVVQAGFLPAGLNPVVAVAGLAGIAFLSYYLLRKTPIGKV